MSKILIVQISRYFENTIQLSRHLISIIFKQCMYMIWIATNFVLCIRRTLLFVLEIRKDFEYMYIPNVVSCNNKELKYCTFHCSIQSKRAAKPKHVSDMSAIFAILFTPFQRITIVCTSFFFAHHNLNCTQI